MRKNILGRLTAFTMALAVVCGGAVSCSNSDKSGKTTASPKTSGGASNEAEQAKANVATSLKAEPIDIKCEFDGIGRMVRIPDSDKIVVSGYKNGNYGDMQAYITDTSFTELKKLEKPHEAIVDALNASFPTIFTSGTILASAGELISFMTTNPVISAIGECLGRGTIISMALVLGVLPQILVLGDFIIEKTSFEMKPIVPQTRQATGTMHLQGRVRGYVSGVIDADVNGVLRGQLNAIISTEDLKTQGTDEADEPDKDNPQLPESSDASPQDTETQQEKPKGGDGDEN